MSDNKGEIIIGAIIIFLAIIVGNSMAGVSITDPSSLENFTFQVNITQEPINYSNLVYGELFNSNIAVVIPTQGAYVNITPLVGDHSNGVDVTGSEMTIETAGDYKIDAQISFSGGANTDYVLSLGINGTDNNHCMTERKLGTGGDVGSASFTCIDALNVNDVLSIMVKNQDNTNNILVAHVNMNIIRVGD